MTNIVILVRDRFRLTEQALDSLYQHTSGQDYNLTLVDDGSTDFRMWNLLRDWAQNPHVSVIRIENGNHVLSQAKNLGAYWSGQVFGRGDWLYLSDNDVYFTKDWLRKLTDVAPTMEMYRFALWGGQIHPFHKTVDEDGEKYPICIADSKGEVAKFNDYNILDGPSWLMRWGTWNYMGGLQRDTAPGVCQSEEYPFCTTLIKRYHRRIGVITPHVVFHTGLTNSEGKDAPGRAEREAQKAPGVLYL